MSSKFFKFLCLFLLIGSSSIEASPEVQELLEDWKSSSSILSASTLADLWIEKDRSASEARFLIGQIRLLIPQAEFENFSHEFLHAFAQRKFDLLDRGESQGLVARVLRRPNPTRHRELARALRNYWIRNSNGNSERVFLALNQFSRISFGSLDELSAFYLQESIDFLPPEPTDDQLDLVNLALIHYSTQLQSIHELAGNMREASPEDWGRLVSLLQFPTQILNNFDADLHSGERVYPFPNGAFAFHRNVFLKRYEEAVRTLFQKADTVQTLILASKIELPETARFQSLHRQLLLEIAPFFLNLNPSFRDFLALMEGFAPSSGPVSDSLRELAREIMGRNLSFKIALNEFARGLAQISDLDEETKSFFQSFIARVQDPQNCRENILAANEFLLFYP